MSDYEKVYTGKEVKAECEHCGHVGDGFREYTNIYGDSYESEFGFLECPNCGLA
jgi:hypothetical protein